MFIWNGSIHFTLPFFIGYCWYYRYRPWQSYCRQVPWMPLASPSLGPLGRPPGAPPMHPGALPQVRVNSTSPLPVSQSVILRQYPWGPPDCIWLAVAAAAWPLNPVAYTLSPPGCSFPHCQLYQNKWYPLPARYVPPTRSLLSAERCTLLLLSHRVLPLLVVWFLSRYSYGFTTEVGSISSKNNPGDIAQPPNNFLCWSGKSVNSSSHSLLSKFSMWDGSMQHFLETYRGFGKQQRFRPCQKNTHMVAFFLKPFPRLLFLGGGGTAVVKVLMTC